MISRKSTVVGQSPCITKVAKLQTSLLSLLGEAARIVPEQIRGPAGTTSLPDQSSSGPTSLAVSY